ncbi:hypothetical protein BT96DRAFT_752763, partial [Gymnopus androsaceus JB14]
FWLILFGTDRLETLFSIFRTMVGNDSSADILQLIECITGTTEVANILAQVPRWDHAPCQMRLRAVSHDGKPVTLADNADNISPVAWVGDVSLKNVSIITQWQMGQSL